jgi:hypothetical protein
LLFLPPKTATELPLSQPASPLEAVVYMDFFMKHFNLDGTSLSECPKVIHDMRLAAQQVLEPL